MFFFRRKRQDIESTSKTESTSRPTAATSRKHDASVKTSKAQTEQAKRIDRQDIESTSGASETENTSRPTAATSRKLGRESTWYLLISRYKKPPLH